MTTSSERSSQQDSRTALLAAAKSLFARKGYAATTVREIVELAGVNVSLISYHFGGKEGIYREVLKALGTESSDLAEEILSTPRTKEEFHQKLKKFITRNLERCADDQDAVFLLSREVDNLTPVFKELLEPLFFTAIKYTENFLIQGQERGYISKGVDTWFLASSLHGQILWIGRSQRIREEMHNKTIREDDERERNINQLFALFTGNISA